MKIVECIQGAPEWFSARCGIPTASNFDKIITTEGKSSKQRQKYLFQLAGEMVSGKPEETYQNSAMQRGNELEAEAREFYSFTAGEEVVQVGLCLSDEIMAGASPDGMVGEKGLLEIKCPTIAVHVGYLLKNELPIEYFQQVQGQLFVIGRDWCDFMSYYPGIKPLIFRVKRDEEFIKLLRIELSVFCQELEETIKRINNV